LIVKRGFPCRDRLGITGADDHPRHVRIDRIVLRSRPTISDTSWGSRGPIRHARAMSRLARQTAITGDN
jgi:hypothetical protein